jgi:hypothetical protein
MLGAAESPLGDREGGATAIFEKSGPPDSADPADFCNKIGPKLLHVRSSGVKRTQYAQTELFGL